MWFAVILTNRDGWQAITYTKNAFNTRGFHAVWLQEHRQLDAVPRPGSASETSEAAGGSLPSFDGSYDKAFFRVLRPAVIFAFA